jgi:PAS domain S-box-containing protein
MSALVAFARPPDEPRRTDLHLRAVLERLPIALLRIDAQGTLLAVNQAGLGLFEAERLDQVLGTSIAGYLDAEARPSCAALLQDAVQGRGGSLETELRGLNGTAHLLELHAVAHPGAPDATPSVLVTLRDITKPRKLQRLLEEAAACAAEVNGAFAAERQQRALELEQLQRLQVRHEDAEREMARLREQLAAGDQQRAALQAQLAASEQALADTRTRHEIVERDAHELRARIAEIQAAERQAAAALESEQSSRARVESDRRRLLDAIAQLARDAHGEA